MEDAIQNLKHRYEQSKCKVVPKHDLKRIKNAKGKWTLKQGRPEDESGKDNAVPYRGFNTVEKGHVEQHVSGNGTKPLQCWICGKDHRRRDFPLHQSGGRPQIYSDQEAHTNGDVIHNIPLI